MGRTKIGVQLTGAIVLALLAQPWALAAQRAETGPAEVVASLPARDRPESVEVIGATMFVGTTTGAEGVAVGDGEPSLIYGFDRRDGSLRHIIPVDGEDVRRFKGIAGMAVDADDRLYAADSQGRILRFTVSGRGAVRQETYAELPDLRPCALTVFAPCSAALDDRGPFPNDLAFADDGTLYVTDSWQAAIWRIPPGGTPEVWFTDRRLDGVIGVNGIALSPDGRELLLTVTGDLTDRSTLYRLPRTETPDAEDLRAMATWQSGGADGVLVGDSGLLYVSLFAQNAISVLDGDGTEVRRITDPLFDEPASMAFDDRNGALLIPNHAFLNVAPAPRTVVRLGVGDRGAPVPRPAVP